MSLVLPILALLGFSSPASLQQDQWTEQRFHRVFLRNGAFIDGNLLQQDEKCVLLSLRNGEMSIRMDMVDHVELVKLRSIRENAPVLLTGGTPVTTVPGKNPRLSPPPSSPGTDKLPPFEADAETKKKVDPLLAELAHTNPEGKLPLLERLSSVGGDAGPYLASLLDKVDRADLSVVTAAIVKSKDLRALPYFIKLSQSSDALLRTAAASGMGGFGDSTAIPTLVALLKDTNPTVAVTALGSLREMSDERAFSPVVALVGHPDRELRSQAILVGRDLAGKLNLEAEFIDVLIASIDKASVPAKFDLITTLGLTKAKAKWFIISGYLQDDEPQVRASAATTLGRLGAAEAAPALISRAAVEEDGRVKLQLALVVRQLNAKGAVDSLIRWLRDPSEQVRSEALSSLQSLTGQKFGEDASRWEAWAAENRQK